MRISYLHVFCNLILTTNVNEAKKNPTFKTINKIRDSVVYLPFLEILTCIPSLKKELRRSKSFLSLSFHIRLYNRTFIIFGIFLWFEKKCWQFSASITFWMSNFHPIVFPHIWRSSSNSTAIFILHNLSTPLWILLRWQVSKLPNTNEKIPCVFIVFQTKYFQQNHCILQLERIIKTIYLSLEVIIYSREVKESLLGQVN